jgi:DNA primase
MRLYTKDSIERVKDTVDMVELVGARTDLRRVGSRWTGLCPFHDERTPSFSVDGERGFYHCFGCGASGDAIGFVEAMEGLDFREAVESLADRYGVELKREQEDPAAEEERKRRERLLKLVERTTSYYERVLWESAEAAHARDYLASRGLQEEVLRTYRVGYSPSAWDKVLLAAQRDGFSREELLAAGLAQQGRDGGGVYDRFRGRIMFPLADARGRVLGFGARTLGEGRGPKYLNTSENSIYHKGRQLFGIHQARPAAATAGRIVAVEGYTDVLALHQAGIKEVVAIMGTALTNEQLQELRRAAPTAFFALDADSAGQEAMLRAGHMARDRDLELLVVQLPDGRDPADLVAENGPEAFRSLLDRALTVAEYEVRRVLASADLGTPRGRDQALAALRPIVAGVPSRTATRDELVRLVADRLNVDRSYVMSQDSASAAPAQAPRQPSRAPLAPLDAVAKSERGFLSMCHGSELGKEYLERLERAHFSYEPLWRVREHLLGHWDDPLIALPDDDESFAVLIKDVVLRAENDDVSAEALRLTFLQLDLARVNRGLRRAEQDQDFESQRTLARDRQRLRDQIDELMGLTL